VNIGKAAVPLGNSMWKAIDRVATRFEEWTGSLTGKITLATYFQNAKAPLAEMGKLVLAVGKGLLDIGTQPGLAPLIKQIREELLPIIENIVITFTKELGPTLVDLGVNLARIFNAMPVGPVKTLLGFASGLAGALADLLDQNPALATFAGLIGGIGSALSALGLASFLSHLLGFRRGFGVAKTAAKGFFDYIGKTDLGTRAYVMASDFIGGWKDPARAWQGRRPAGDPRADLDPEADPLDRRRAGSRDLYRRPRGRDAERIGASQRGEQSAREDRRGRLARRVPCRRRSRPREALPDASG
jgi:hypothetical protein